MWGKIKGDRYEGESVSKLEKKWKESDRKFRKYTNCYNRFSSSLFPIFYSIAPSSLLILNYFTDGLTTHNLILYFISYLTLCVTHLHSAAARKSM